MSQPEYMLHRLEDQCGEAISALQRGRVSETEQHLRILRDQLRENDETIDKLVYILRHGRQKQSKSNA